MLELFVARHRSDAFFNGGIRVLQVHEKMARLVPAAQLDDASILPASRTTIGVIEVFVVGRHFFR